MKKLIFTFALFGLFCNLLIAQDISHLFIPYGFQLPYLKSGEYIISFSGTNYFSDYSSVYYSPNIESKSEYDRLYGNIRGVLAITDNLLFRLNLQYYPKQEIGSYRYTSESYISEHTSTVKNYFTPDFGLVFRPTSSLEIYGTFFISSYSESYDYKQDIDDWDRKKSTIDSQNISVGFNYFGKLWDN